MKTTIYSILISCAMLLFCTSCGNDEESVLVPEIDETSISYNSISKTISFKATCPEGTKVQVLVQQQTNGNDEKILTPYYRASTKDYYANVTNLIGGSTYVYYIIGYNSEGEESFRSGQRTFTEAKYPSPMAPSVKGISAYPPTSLVASDGYIDGEVITKEMEYSIDNGQTWMPVTRDGRITGLPACKLLLRIAETATTEAGRTAIVVVPPYKSNTDLDGSDGNSEGLTSAGPLSSSN